MKAALMEISFAQAQSILAGESRIANIPAGARIERIWTDADVDHVLTRSGPSRLVFRIEHPSYADVSFRVPVVQAEIVETTLPAAAAPARKPPQPSLFLSQSRRRA